MDVNEIREGIDIIEDTYGIETTYSENKPIDCNKTKDEVRFLIDTMTWSFSRVNSFDTGCRFGWYLSYIERLGGAPGFFGAYGSFCHEILEKYFKGELNIFDLSQYYIDHFNEVVYMDAPPNNYVDLKESYYNKGLKFFNEFSPNMENYEIVGVEKKVEFEIEGYPFVGYIDLLCRDKRDNKFVLIDHKSATIKVLQSGAISKKDQHHFLEFKRQQYLYSKAVIEEFGADCVKELKWNMFKDCTWLGCKWSKEEYQEALDWAVKTIHEIEEEDTWAMKEETDFFCNYLCDTKSFCPLYLESRNYA